MSTTLSDLYFAIRSEGDELTSDFILDDELLVYVNQSYRSLYDECITRDMYALTSSTVTVATPNYSFPIPDDFYRLKGVNVMVSGQPWTVDRYQWKNRNQRNWPWTAPFYNPNIRVQYELEGDNVVLSPQQQAPGTYQLWYYPMLTPLSASADPIKPWCDRNGWWEYIVVDCCIKVKNKGDYPVDDYIMRKQELLQKLDSMATKRDANSPVVGTGWNQGGQGFGGANGGWGY